MSLSMKRYAVCLFLLALALNASEYAAYTTDTLLKLRGTLASPKEERMLQEALQKRLPLMSEEELERFITPPRQQNIHGMGDGRIATH